jgi:DNA-binding NarL/FixJ family response regulator
MSPRPEGAIKIALIEPEPAHSAFIDELIRRGGVPSERTSASKADIIILGLETLGESEIDFIGSLHAMFADTPIVILSGTDARLWTGEAVRLGARHVLAKDDLTSDKLASAIHACCAGSDVASAAFSYCP